MNPSTEDFVEAVKRVHADTVFLLPNNGNIVMAAEQAANMVEQEVIVIPTKTIPQGMASLFVFNQELDAHANETEMKSALKNVKSGQVTYAVRDTSVNGVSIKKDDYLSIFENQIVSTSIDGMDALLQLVTHMLDDDSELVTIIYGESIDSDQMDKVETLLTEKFSQIEFEWIEGNQPVYSFIVAVE